MRGLIVPDSYRFPARPPKLNPRHPLVVRGALRMAPVCIGGASMTDLFTGHVATNTNLAGVNTNSGPMVVPSPGTNSNLCSLSFPVIHPTETMLNITMAAIIQPMVLGGGQGFITVDASTGGDWKLQSNTTGITLVIGGSIIFGNTQAKVGHTYFCAATRATISTGQYSAVFMDMTSGVMYQNFKAGQTTSPISGATAYSMVTYNAGTAVDAGRVACGVIAATAITPDQLLAWAQDPWSLWYDPGARNLLYGSGSYVVRGGPPPTGIQKYAPPTGFLAWDDPPGAAAWAVIASTSSLGQTTTAINTTGADLLVVVFATEAPGTINDSYSNTWTTVVGTYVYIYYCQGGTVGPGHIVTIDGGLYPSIAFAAFSGSTANPADQVAFSALNAGAAGPITPSVPNALIVAGGCTNGAISGITAGFTILASNPAVTNFGNAIAYQVLATPTATTATWTDSSPEQAVIMSFKPAGSPATSVWSASDAAANAMTLSNGGLTVTGIGSGISPPTTRGTISKTTGKLYIEFLANATTSADYDYFGLASASFNPTGRLGNTTYSGGATYSSNVVSSGFTSNFSSPITPVVNDVWGLAVDFTAGNIWLAQNNVWLNGGNPAAGTLPIMSFVPATVGALFPALSLDAAETWTLQPTAASQTYAPPAGFTPWG